MESSQIRRCRRAPPALLADTASPQRPQGLAHLFWMKSNGYCLSFVNFYPKLNPRYRGGGFRATRNVLFSAQTNLSLSTLAGTPRYAALCRIRRRRTGAYMR
nr:hypothetical protein SHINE37_70318 [Rhizobiaceae bacterium]